MKPSLFKRKKYLLGEKIFEENDSGDCAFLIRSGIVEIYKVLHGKKISIGLLKAGSIIGEMSVITGEPRNASAVAKEKCELLIVNEKSLQHTLDECVPFIQALVRQILSRFKDMNRKYKEVNDLINRIKKLENTILTIQHETRKWETSQQRLTDENLLFSWKIDKLCKKELRERLK